MAFENLVVERHEELPAARVALTPGPAEQLAVDSQRFVPFGADDVQAAGGAIGPAGSLVIQSSPWDS